MSNPRATLLLVALVFLSEVALAGAAGVHGLAIEDASDTTAVFSALETAHVAPASLGLHVRIQLDRSALEPTPGDYRFETLQARIELYRTRGAALIFAIAAPPNAAGAEGWRSFVRALATRYQKTYSILEISVDRGTAPSDASFLLKAAAVEVHATDPDADVLISGLADAETAFVDGLFSEGLSAYTNGFSAPAIDAALEQVARVALSHDPSAGIVATDLALADSPATAARQLLEWEFAHKGTKLGLTVYRGSAASLAGGLVAAAQVKDFLTGEVEPIDAFVSKLAATHLDGSSPAQTLSLRALYDTQRFGTYIALFGPRESVPLRLTVKEATGRKCVVRDPLAARVTPVSDFSWDEASGVARFVLPEASGPLLVDFTYLGEPTRASRVEVTGRRLPSVEEVISRHQEVQAAQDAVLKGYVARAHMEQHFRTSLTDAGYDVVTDNHFFWDPSGAEWEETSFLLNGTRWAHDRPAFPMLQAEKVLSLPLDLRLSRDYGYRLEGLGSVDDREAYVVRFEPTDDSRPLYRGTAWIDTKTFARLKTQTVQTHPGVPVVSNEEIQYYAEQGVVAGRPIHLLSRLSGRQTILVAGRNLLVEREIAFTDVLLNPPDFAERRETARKGDAIMYRETDKGLRYFAKKDGGRVVSETPTTRAKAFAMGTLIDPSYDFPLPIIGLNYLDFEFMGKKNQLALLFGGVLALANVQRPQLIGRHIDASLDIFGIGVSGTDTTFDAEGKHTDEAVKSRAFSTGLNLGWQATDFFKLSTYQQLRLDAYSASDKATPDFVAPKSTATYGSGLALEYRKSGYSLLASGSWFWRTRWDPWGNGNDYDPSQRDYFKYQFSLTKDFYSGPHKLHLNGAYFSGRDLDRFSLYQFGLFEDTRIHGVPSSGIRFGELGMLRGSYSLNLLELYRFDVFVEQALGKDPFGGKDWLPITGLGLGFNFRGPWRTMVRGDVGKSFLPDVYAGAGSFVAQITFLKPL